jgi:hypothetical protein
MLNFLISTIKKYNSNKKQYICVAWADSRRRDIYQRLVKEGFIFTMDDGEKILMKRFNSYIF